MHVNLSHGGWENVHTVHPNLGTCSRQTLAETDQMLATAILTLLLYLQNIVCASMCILESVFEQLTRVTKNNNNEIWQNAVNKVKQSIKCKHTK